MESTKTSNTPFQLFPSCNDRFSKFPNTSDDLITRMQTPLLSRDEQPLALCQLTHLLEMAYTTFLVAGVSFSYHVANRGQLLDTIVSRNREPLL